MPESTLSSDREQRGYGGQGGQGAQGGQGVHGGHGLGRTCAHSRSQTVHSDSVIRRKAGDKQATVRSCDTFGGRWGFSMREGEKQAVTRQPRVCKRGTGRKDEGDGERRRQRKQQEEEQHMSAARSRRRRRRKNPRGEGMKKGMGGGWGGCVRG